MITRADFIRDTAQGIILSLASVDRTTANGVPLAQVVADATELADALPAECFESEAPGVNAEHVAVLRQDLADYRTLHGDLVKTIAEKDARIAELESAVSARDVP